LHSEFNPVGVLGEVSGYTRAFSGHCYFSLKDASGQLRCAMFRRVADTVGFALRDGDRVEVHGQLGVYDARGELQIVVEAVRQAGQGALLEQFLKIKEKLALEGLFENGRKRRLPAYPKGIGVVTSLGAAALHDVAATLKRRVPHIPVTLVSAAVQGTQAPAELVAALAALYQRTGAAAARGEAPVDVILLVRGGGSLEDLWAFNDEALARTIAASPVPLVCGVGHETDFTIADFVADVRAPTPTAAAELVSASVQELQLAVTRAQDLLRDAALRVQDRCAQRLDLLSGRLGRPSAMMARQQTSLSLMQQRLRLAGGHALAGGKKDWDRRYLALQQARQVTLQLMSDRTKGAQVRLQLLDPARVLKRGFAWLKSTNGQMVSSVDDVSVGQELQASLADGTVDMQVVSRKRK
jgi:exodeoxyribonuclease VII large subunit